MKMLSRCWKLLLLLLLFTRGLPDSANAQSDFPEPSNSERDSSASPMPAEQAAKGFKTPPGFTVEVFAAEPDVQNPIDMAWDARGRIWIAENYTYAERSQRFDLTLRDRVVVLEDTDGDGRSDKRIVFTDQVQMLTSVEVGLGGVWLMCPDKLLFLPDRDGDDRPDGPPQVVLDGFTVAKDNYHNFANGLRWGPDGWLYGRCGGSCPGRIGKPGAAADERVALEGGVWRYHPGTQRVESLVHGTTNPWGHDWDAMGEAFFINTVNGHLWHLIPGAHLMRPFTLDPNPLAYELIDMHADHWHFDTGASWTKSRDGAANAYGGGHAHVGMMIYQGDNWPEEYRGRLLTWNIHGRRANQEILERQGSGYVGRHGKDLFEAKDPFFRGMELSYGPDGAVYALDWSDTGECHEHTGVHRTSGRIFRIAYGDKAKPPTSLNLANVSGAELAKLHQHRNEWFVRQARLQLMDRSQRGTADKAATRLLSEFVAGDDPMIAYRALVTLHAMGAAPREQLMGLLEHKNEHLRGWAVQLLTDNWPLDDVFGPRKLAPELAAEIDAEAKDLFGRLIDTARREDSALVRLKLASAISRLPSMGQRMVLALVLSQHEEDAQDHNLPLLVWYGVMPLVEANPGWAATLTIDSKWPKTRRFLARRLGERIDESTVAVDRLVQHIGSTDDVESRRDLLLGLSEGLRGRSKAPKPQSWDEAATSLGDLEGELAAVVRDLSVLFGDGRALSAVRKLVLDKSSDAALRRSALKTLVDRDADNLQEICLAVLNESSLNVIAAQGLARTDSRETALALVKNYRRFRSPQRPQVISILASRPQFAAALLDAVADNKIPATDLTAYDVRQIRSLEVDALQKRISELWGELRTTPEAKKKRIAQLRDQLTPETLSSANLAAGRKLFDRSCAKCHRLFGVGESIGPDLTGANRTNLDYLLENILDPSAVVSKNYRMSIIHTADGRVLNGLVLSKSEKTLSLQTQTDKLTLSLDAVESTKLTTESPMPDGLLDSLTAAQIRDLISYLMQPVQVAAE